MNTHGADSKTSYVIANPRVDVPIQERSHGILDGVVIESLKEIMGKDFGLLIDTYRNDFQQRLCCMVKAVAEQNVDELCKAAHSLKGSSGNLGAHTVEQLCRALEADARSGDIDHANCLVSRIRSIYDALLPELDRLAQH